MSALKNTPENYTCVIPLRFRFYHIENCCLSYSDKDYNNNLSLFFDDFQKYSDKNLMVSTEYYDKNKTLIYTGDIVSFYIKRFSAENTSEYDGMYKIFGELSFDTKTQRLKLIPFEKQTKEISKKKPGEDFKRKVEIDDLWSYSYNYVKTRKRDYQEMLDKIVDIEQKESYSSIIETKQEHDGCKLEGNIYNIEEGDRYA